MCVRCAHGANTDSFSLDPVEVCIHGPFSLCAVYPAAPVCPLIKVAYPRNKEWEVVQMALGILLAFMKYFGFSEFPLVLNTF